MFLKQMIAVAAVACGALAAMATEYTWTGAQDACWTNKANWNVGSAVATTVPGSESGDKVTFPELPTPDPIVVNLDGMTQIKYVTFDCGTNTYQLGTNGLAAQALNLQSSAVLTVNAGVTTNQSILSLQTIAGGSVSLYNNSTSAKFIYGNLLKKSGGNPSYYCYGAGVIEMDGTTSFDQVSSFNFCNTGKFILGDKSHSTGSRVSSFYSHSASGLSGYRQIEIPKGRYLNETGGGWSSVTFNAYENTRIFGDGIVVARYHFNCKTVESQEYSASFCVSSGKELKIESYVCRLSNDMPAWGGPGLISGAGTLYLCSSNNLPGQARIHTAGTLAVDKIGLKNCKTDESNLGLGDAIRYMDSGTLEYRGSTGETTDRDLIASNSSSRITMTLANAGGGPLVWTGTAKQSFAASECVGAKLQFRAKNSPIICQGSLEADKDWALVVSGDAGVMLRSDFGTGIPISLNAGRLLLTNDVTCTSPITVDDTSTIEICANCEITLPDVPAVGGSSSVLKFIVPDSSSVKFTAKKSMRLDNVTVNGYAAKLDADGYLYADTTVYGTSVWTATTSGGNWSTAANWLDERVPGEYDNVIVSNLNDSAHSYTITLDTPATVNVFRVQAAKSGEQKLDGDKVLTIGGGGYISITNTAVSNGHSDFDGGPFTFNVPLHLASSQRWLLGSARGQGANDWNSRRFFTKDISSEPDIEWGIFGYARYCFTSGSSSNFQGTVSLGSFVQFTGTNQFHRLGTNGITLTCKTLSDDTAVANGTKRMSPGLVYIFNGASETNATVTTPIGVDVTTAVAAGRNGWSYADIPICMRIPSDATCGEPFALTLSGGLSGSVSGSGMQLAFSQTSNQMYPTGVSSFNFYPEDQKIILSGDGRNLTGDPVRTYTMLEIANQNAIGLDNSRGVTCGYDGYWSSQCYNTIQGVSLLADLSMSGSIAAAASSDVNGSNNRIAYMQVGSAPSPANPSAKRATFTGSVYEVGQNGFRLRLYAAKGTEAHFTGKVTTLLPLSHPYGEHPDILGLGDVILYNSGNSFATNVCVRSGRLVLEANGAAGSKPIWLGGFVPTLSEIKEVRCVSANMNISCSVASEEVGGVTKYAHKLTISGSVPSIDGVTVKGGDYVLVSWPRATVANGLWQVSADDVKVWRRPDDLDEPNDILGKVGLRLKVKEGKRFGGKAFMLSYNPQYYRKSSAFTEENDRFSCNKSVPVFHPEATANPDVAVLTGADGLTLTCGIDVTDNASTGSSTIGSKIENSTSGFSGAIRLAKSVTLAAATGSTVNFTGTISGTGDIIGGGEGVCDMTGATLSTDSTNAFRIASGTLKVTAAQLGSRPLVWVRTESDNDYTTGTLVVTGDLDLSSRTVDISSFELSLAAGDDTRTVRKWTLATATGTITLPTSITLPRNWKLSAESGKLYATYTPPGTVILLY